MRVIRHPSYTFSLALHWRVCLGPTGSQANNDLEMTLHSAPESNSQLTLVSAILSETCQSSWEGRSSLDSTEKVRRLPSLPLLSDSASACTVFPPKSCSLFRQTLAKWSHFWHHVKERVSESSWSASESKVQFLNILMSMCVMHHANILTSRPWHCLHLAIVKSCWVLPCSKNRVFLQNDFFRPRISFVLEVNEWNLWVRDSLRDKNKYLERVFVKNNYNADFIRLNIYRPTEADAMNQNLTHVTSDYTLQNNYVTALTNIKDQDKPNHRQGEVYKIKCSDCQASYIGETGRNLNMRLTEHKQATRNGDANNHIAAHHQLTNHNTDWDSAQCLTYSTNYFQRLTLESWCTNLEQTSLNRC